MTDLQEMSDYLAEHLLGWNVDDMLWFDKNNKPVINHSDFVTRNSWRPHSDIAQCFEYIVPAMTKIGWQLSLDVGETSSSAMWWRPVCFPAPFKLQHSLTSAAVVEATYQAIKEQK